MNKAQVLEKIVSVGVIPVIRANDPDEALQAVEAIRAGGISVFEITLTVPGAIGLIKRLSLDTDLLIGAGTVLDPNSARECIDAGARFIISPGTNFEVIDLCVASGVAVFPGALTPTEIIRAIDAGADAVKIFPASALGGSAYLRALKAPLPSIRMIPTGGVDLKNAAEYIIAGAEAIGVGGDLVDLAAIRNGEPERLTQMAMLFLEEVAKARKFPIDQ